MQPKLTIQERLKDLRVERGLTLEQLSAETSISKSALGKYEADDFKDISPFSMVALAKFYGVSTMLNGLMSLKSSASYFPSADFEMLVSAESDYLLGLTRTKSPKHRAGRSAFG